jgi:hypothetical protein
MPLKVTAVAPERPVPLTVTVLPAGPEASVKPVIAGAGTTVKLVVLRPCRWEW